MRRLLFPKKEGEKNIKNLLLIFRNSTFTDALLEAPTFYESTPTEKSLFEDIKKEREQTDKLWEKWQLSVTQEQTSFTDSVQATMQKLMHPEPSKNYGNTPKKAKVDDLLTNLDDLKKQEQKFLEYLKKCL
jgi:hypothetical protein